MPTIIDSLLVTLGLDPSGFKKGHKEAQDVQKKTGDEAKKVNSEMQLGVKNLAEGYRTLTTTIAAFTGVAIGAGWVRQFVENITKSDAATGRLATNVGVATQELSAWQNAAKRFGATAEDMAGGFRIVNDIAQNLRNNGWDERILPLQRAGLDTTKFFAASTDNVERMRMLVDLFGKLSAQDAQFWGQQAGFSEAAITAMREMQPELDGILKKQRDLNAASEEDKRLAIERQKAWADLTDTVEGYGRAALNALTPAMTGAGKALTGPNPFAGVPGGGALNLLLGAGAGMLKDNGYTPSTPGERRSSGTVGAVSAPAAGAGALLSSLERQYGLPAGLLDSVWAQESSRGKNMLSSAGAKGHFGFMPNTAAEYGIAGQENDFGASADGAARKLRDLMKRYGGNLNTALAAYNAGDKRVLAGGPLPAETIKYIEQVTSRMGAAGGGRSVQIDQVNVYSNAKDGNGLARDFVHSTERELSMAAQAESGVN